MIEVALCGTPSVGKSTFFKAATLKDVKIAPYPFTTTKPTEGLAYVTKKCPCRELKLTCEQCFDGIRYIPIKLWDIVGLVKDAHLGRGRGIAFLDDIMQCEALIHIIDISGRIDDEGNPAEDFYPGDSIKMLENEFNYWLLSIFKKDWKKLNGDFVKTFKKRFSGLRISESQIDLALKKSKLNPEKAKNWTEYEILTFIDNLRKISKPLLIAANKIDIPNSEKRLERLKKDFPDYMIIPTSAECELALKEASRDGLIKYVGNDFEIINEKRLNERQKHALMVIKRFLETHKTTGVQDVLNSVAFKLLNLIVVYPVADIHKFSDRHGRILPDAFLLRKGSTALELAYQIHEEIGKKFISAVDARTGKNISANYELKDDDIIFIRHGR